MAMMVPMRRNRNLLSELMTDPFDAFFNAASAPMQKMSPTLMRTDIKETDGGYELVIDMPGFKKDDVQAELKDGYLTIAAQTQSESEDKDEKGTYVRKERFSGKCSRTFYVGDDIEEDDIKAKFEDGTLKIDMNFLPDVYVDCEVCHGKRYNRETLEVTYNGKTVADILNMPIEEAADFFKAYTGISRYLKTLVDVGLGYIRLGQPAPTLSGGESQRVKLATELQRRSDGKTVYILDEPTTGLHFEDVNKLLKVLQSLVDKGNTVIVIEHNLDVIKEADWLIDLGPEGGDGGGTIVTQGTPEQVAECEASWTGKFLKPML